LNKTSYEILNISEKASFEEIRKAYLKQVRLSPPEKDPEGFKRIRKAYETLKDYESRKKLDFSSFRSKPDFKPEQEDKNIDFNLLFKDRIFMLLLASSNLYMDNFKEYFANIKDKVNKLR